MIDETTTGPAEGTSSEAHPPEKTARKKPPQRKTRALAPEERARIHELGRLGSSSREIAKRLGLGRRIVRRVLDESPTTTTTTVPSDSPTPTQASTTEAAGDEPSKPTTTASDASKLDPFREAIAERVKKDLTTTRILREISALGYTGGRSILGDYARTIRVRTAEGKQRAWRRFETPPAEELQIDWSPYSVPLGGKVVRVVAFAATLCWSRKLHVRFYRDERQATLLTALDAALHDVGGVTRRVVVDGMSTAVLARVGSDGLPLWHPRFAAFAELYGFTPFLCKPGDPDRKGKDERAFWYLELDFVRGSEWTSLEHMNEAVRHWLDHVANARVHRTTRKVPDEAWREERPLLIPLPAARPMLFDEETREVGDDTVISVRGTAYTVPARLAGRTVVVRLHADRFEVIEPRTGEVAFGRAYVPDADKGRLMIDPTHHAALTPRRRPGRARLDAALLRRFPSLASLVDGLRRRFKGLAHVQLARLSRLAERYGDAAFLAAATRAQELRRFDALDVERLLERDHPLLLDHDPVPPVGAAARVLVAISDVDPISLDDDAPQDGDEDQDDDSADGDREVDHGA